MILFVSSANFEACLLLDASGKQGPCIKQQVISLWVIIMWKYAAVNFCVLRIIWFLTKDII